MATAPKPADKTAAVATPPAVPYIVGKIVAAKGLPKMDWGEGHMDAYVNLMFKDKKQFGTKKQFDIGAPGNCSFDHAFTLPLKADDLKKGVIKFDVKDDDAMHVNPTAGSVEVKLSEVPVVYEGQITKPVDKWYPIVDPKDKKANRGQLNLHLQLVQKAPPPPKKPAAPAATPAAHPAAKEPEKEEGPLTPRNIIIAGVVAVSLVVLKLVTSGSE